MQSIYPLAQRLFFFWTFALTKGRGREAEIERDRDRYRDRMRTGWQLALQRRFVFLC